MWFNSNLNHSIWLDKISYLQVKAAKTKIFQRCAATAYPPTMRNRTLRELSAATNS